MSVERWRDSLACSTRAASSSSAYEYFILPVTQVEPFDVNTPYPTEIAGTP